MLCIINADSPVAPLELPSLRLLLMVMPKQVTMMLLRERGDRWPTATAAMILEAIPTVLFFFTAAFF